MPIAAAHGERHGLTTGSPGSGKTVSPQGLAEAISRVDTLVFMADQAQAVAMQKLGAELVPPWHAQRSQTHAFAETWNKSMPMAGQIRRSDFDRS